MALSAPIVNNPSTTHITMVSTAAKEIRELVSFFICDYLINSLALVMMDL